MPEMLTKVSRYPQNGQRLALLAHVMAKLVDARAVLGPC
jgi:hypothetical protein